MRQIDMQISSIRALRIPTVGDSSGSAPFALRTGKAWYLLSLSLLALASLATHISAQEAEATWGDARRQIAAAEYSKADATLSKLLESDAKFAPAWYYRGRVRFRLGRFRESLSDFNRYVELEPRLASRQWERGIACYYAEAYQEGADQFKLYQTYHDNDVENSVWRFLCMTPQSGVQAARRTMLPIRNDRRIPMMAIYDLYRGAGTVWDVHEAVVGDDPDAQTLAYREFYAHLYLGLYFEVLGQEELAKRFVFSAAKHEKTQGINNYMWAVADVHAQRIRRTDPDMEKEVQ